MSKGRGRVLTDRNERIRRVVIALLKTYPGPHSAADIKNLLTNMGMEFNNEFEIYNQLAVLSKNFTLKRQSLKTKRFGLRAHYSIFTAEDADEEDDYAY